MKTAETASRSLGKPRMDDDERRDRMIVANVVLGTFSIARIEYRPGGMFVSWPTERRGRICRRWQCRGQSFYPVWTRIYPGGGTSVTALSQLVRWVQGKPVLPISTWRYWASERCKLLSPEAIDHLLKAGYPEHVDCVLCGEQCDGLMGWWHLDGLSGPCCAWTTGCRQRKTEKA